MADHMPETPLWLRYCLLQVPGMLVLVMLLGFGLREEMIAPRVAAGIIVLWLIKDAVLYIPWRRALNQPPVPLGRNALTGSTGTARIGITAHRGLVRVGGETWQARCKSGERIIAGSRVKVLAINGMVLTVTRATE